MSSILEQRLTETHKLSEEYSKLIYKACEAADMQIGENIHYLPDIIKKLRKERDSLLLQVKELNRNFLEDRGIY